MPTLRILLICLSLALLTAPVYAGCPVEGTYTAISGDIFEGRSSEAWPGGGEGQLGNSVLGQSWDSVSLGSQWELSCPQICVAPVLLLDTVNGSGYGQRTYITQYCGGTLWLDGGTQAWSNGDADYTLNLSSTYFYTTIQYAAGVPVAKVNNIQLSGHFDGCQESCIGFEIANAAEIGNGILGQNFPANYPLPVQAGTCAQDPLLLGSYWNVTSITMTIIGCSVPTREISWGAAKSLYR